jgi:hypothetical protein
MTVKMFKKEWKVKALVYKEKRELWQDSIRAFPEGAVDQSGYFVLMNRVEDLSGLKEADYIKDDKTPLTMGEIDLLLQEVFTQYMGIEKKG